MTYLLIARHGNTFDKGESTRRIGKRTNLPLSNSGKTQAQALGQYLQQHHPTLTAVYTSTLQRTQQTAHIALASLPAPPDVKILEQFDEIDYGIDEGKLETEVLKRLGQEALSRWNENAEPPDGWKVNPQQLIQQWQDFADQSRHNFPEGTVLVVTSNGVARFAPHILPDYKTFQSAHPLKLATGAIACFHYQQRKWHCKTWNQSC